MFQYVVSGVGEVYERYVRISASANLMTEMGNVDNIRYRRKQLATIAAQP